MSINEYRRPPKYLEAYRSNPLLYPGPEAVRPGRALVITEGEFDALLLAQELGDAVGVVTLGSASNGPDLPIRDGLLLPAPRWFVSLDADEAGDRAAASWQSFACSRRVRPPIGKDWTDAQAGGLNLSRWWGDILAGNPAPPLFTPVELASWRWGPAMTEHEGGAR